MIPRYDAWVHPDQLVVAIDPGVSGIGYCALQRGKVLNSGTVRPTKQGTVDERLLDLKQKLDEVFMQLYDAVSLANDEMPPIAVVAIETYQGHTNKNNMLSMMTNCQARGICLAVADSWAAQVVPINKRTAPKSDADWLALSANIKGSEHARDAYHLAIIAGFDRPPRVKEQ